MSRPSGGLATVAVVWVTLAVAYGLFFSFSIFFVPLIEEFRWSRALTAGALSLSTIVQGLLAPLVGLLTDRVGPRPVILTGVGLLAASSVLMGTVREPWQLYLYSGVLGGMGIVSLGWVPMGVLLSRRFPARLGRVAGTAFSGMGIGVFVVGPLSQWLIASIGWRGASTALGIAVFVVLAPVVWFGTQGDRRGQPGGRPAVAVGGQTLGDALGGRAFWALFCANLFTPLAVFPVFTHQVAFAIDHGFPRLLVAWLFGLMGLFSTGGRVLFGVLADRIGGPMAATLSFACTATGAMALVAADVRPWIGWLVTHAVFFGLGFGARGPIVASIAGRLFAGRQFGIIYGLLNLSNGIGMALGPWFGGLVHDVSGSYRLAFGGAAGLAVVGAACFWLLPGRGGTSGGAAPAPGEVRSGA